MTAPAPLIPARLTFQADGTPISEAYGDVYHSADGGLGQARHVFLAGNRLPGRWQGREIFAILETGFGLGLNFLATWQAWKDDPQRSERLHFTSIEKHPFSRQDLETLHARWPEFAGLSKELLTKWPILVPGFHRLHLNDGRVVLTLALGDAIELLPQIDANVDTFYLDGFAPAKNPDLWSSRVYKALSRLAAQDATLATYTVAASVRTGLAQANFTVEKQPGYGRKRDMLAGRYAPPAYWPPRPITSPPVDRHAVVIGAGLAGSAIADRLAERGWAIDLIDRHETAAQEASGNPTGILRPLLSMDDNITSRLLRAGFLYAQRDWTARKAAGRPIIWNPCGVLHLARDAKQEQHQQAIIERFAYLEDYVTYLDKDQASSLAGHSLSAGGWLFPTAGVASPPSICNERIDGHQELIRTYYTKEAINILRLNDGWQVIDSMGNAIAEAPVVIFANAADAKCLPQASHLPFQRIRGQVTFLPVQPELTVPLVISQEGYLTPPESGRISVGASFDFDDDPAIRLSSHIGNLQHLEHLLPGAAKNLDARSLAGRVSFRAVLTDRLPAIGRLPDIEQAWAQGESKLNEAPRFPGLYCLLGFGARGLAWSSLGAELLASQINQEPLPLETRLVAAVDPARFILHAIRHRY